MNNEIQERLIKAYTAVLQDHVSQRREMTMMEEDYAEDLYKSMAEVVEDVSEEQFAKYQGIWDLLVKIFD